MQISGDAEEVEEKHVAKEEDASIEGVKLGKDAEQNKYVTETLLVVEEINKEETISFHQSRMESITYKKGYIT